MGQVFRGGHLGAPLIGKPLERFVQPQSSKRKSVVEVLLDHEASTELLCYLVVSQLAAVTLTGEWMRTDHLVESIRTWLGANGAQAHWSERVCLGALSEKVAADFSDQPPLKDSAALARLFVDCRYLDYRSPLVRGIHAACESELIAGV
jgi:hypothetical protein